VIWGTDEEGGSRQTVALCLRDLPVIFGRHREDVGVGAMSRDLAVI
jgi:hypothetical protein